MFSVTFAYDAALGENVGRTTFAHARRDAPPSRAVLDARKLMPFPGESKKVHRYRKNFFFFVPLYCACGLPESHESEMVLCDRCGQWFHFRCMHIQISNTTSETWICSDCI